MKKMKLFLIVTIFAAFSLNGQTVDLRFVVIENNGSNFDVQVQIQGNPTFKLGSSNLRLNFNSADLGSPSLLTAHNFSGLTNFYQDMTVTEVAPGLASVNIELLAATLGTPVNTTWTEVATIRFQTLNATGNAGLSFQDLGLLGNLTKIFLDDESSNPTQGVFSPLDQTPLPVELSSFNVNAVEGVKAQLQWETATEVNNYGFEIERSVVVENAVKDASTPLSMTDKQWEKVAFVEGHGNSNSPKLYSFTDKNLIGGSKFVYRLKQIDIDGTFEYSDEVEIEILPTRYELMQNYPNPFNPTTKIRFSLPEDAKIGINVYNILGEKVASVLNEELKAGFHEVDFNSSSAGYSLATGVYIYTIETKNFSQVKKMILMK